MSFLGCVPWFIAVKHIGPLYDFPLVTIPSGLFVCLYPPADHVIRTWKLLLLGAGPWGAGHPAPARHSHRPPDCFSFKFTGFFPTVDKYIQ